ncbi:MAG: hypothetical protein ACE5FG_03170 [Myxococcota bacterium]
MSSTPPALLLRVALLLPVTIVLAGPAQGQLEKDEQRCINTLNKNLQKVSAARGKALSSCLKDFAKGDTGSVPACIDADPKGKIGKAEAKASSEEQKQCATVPSVLAGSAAQNNTLVLAKEEALLEIVFGSDVEAGTLAEADGKDAAKCQQKVVKSLVKCQDTKLKEFNKCKKAALKDGGAVPEVEACLSGLATQSKVARLCTKVLGDLEKKCVAKQVDLQQVFPQCLSTDAATVFACLETPLECEVCRALVAADGLSVDCDAFDDGELNNSCMSDSGCEELNAAECLLPYPSTALMVPASTPTGWRVNLPATGMPKMNGAPYLPDPINELDGFQPFVAILTHFPEGVDPELSDAARLLPAGCCGQPPGPPWVDTRTYTARSLDSNSPTVLMDADTGERILHFIEPDAHAAGNLARQATILRPARLLTPGHRYIVAMRNLKDPNGQPVQASDAFAALRDGTPFRSIEGRRAYMEANVFAPLASHGIARADLVLAFDFVVQSTSQLTRQILSMRDQGYAYVAAIEADPNAVPFTVDSVMENDCNVPGQVVWRDVSGTMDVPLFLTGPPLEFTVPTMNEDPNDLPLQNGTYSEVMDFSIPCSVLDANGPVARPIVLGHGLFGTGASMTQGIPLLAGSVASWSYIAGATNWRGLSSPDFLWVGGSIIGIINHNLNNFPALADRLRQGMSNTLVLARLMKRGIFNRDPAFQTPSGDGVFPGPSEEMYYYGISLGGIMGTYFAGLSADVERFAVDVPAVGFGCLLQRSTQFTQFEALLAGIGLTDPMQTVVMLGLLQELWAGAEPTSVAAHILQDPLPGSGGPKRLMMTPAWLDKQVSNQCSEIAARSIGLSNMEGSIQSGLVGIPDVPSPQDSAYVMYDTGSFDLFNPAHAPFIPPLANLIPSSVCDPHGARPAIPAGIDQLLGFLQPGGQVMNFCNGLCDAGEPLEISGGAASPCDPLN